jgi:F-type H+-transporting ATPase subunit a
VEKQTPFKWLIEAINLHPSLASEYIHISMSVIALAIITALSIAVWKRAKVPEDHLLPDDRASAINIFEVLISALSRISEDIIGPSYKRHLPIICIIFIYILICNLMAVIPWVKPPTENINTNLSVAIVVFVYYNIAGIRELGFKGYFKSMSGPIVWIAPLMLAIEIVSHIVRPISLSIRLFGNIMGDHMVLGLFSELIPFVIPIIFMFMAIFIAFIQAFVFTLLSIIYISLATGGLEQHHAKKVSDTF